MPPVSPPQVSPTFTGREQELARCRRALADMPVVVVVGVAGIGKSALAHALAAEHAGPVVYTRVGSEPVTAVLNDARHQLSDGAIADLHGDDERVRALAAELDSRAALWTIDDLHALPPDACRWLLATLGGALRRGRVIATSRERPPRHAGDPDRLELHLQGLDEAAARALWQALDALYEPAGAFEAAWRRTRGSPFQLRCAHAGGLDEQDPLAAVIRDLSDDARRAAAAIALSEVRLPAAAVDAVVDAGRAQDALRELVAKLVIDIDGAHTCGMHGLFRDVITREIAPALAARVRVRLADVLADAPAGADTGMGPVARVREVARHLHALGEHARLEEHIVSCAPELVRIGHAPEVVRWLDAVPEGQRSPRARMVWARCVAQVLDFSTAYQELARLVEVAPSPEVRAHFGEVALTCGHAAVAERALDALRADAGASPAWRLQAGMLRAFAIHLQGRGDEALAWLRGAEERADRADAARLALAQARLLWLEERHRDAAAALARAWPLLDRPELVPFDNMDPMLPFIFASHLARAGRLDEADAIVAEADAAGRSDPAPELVRRRMRADILYQRGEREAALEMLEQVTAAYERAGSLMGALIVKPWLGRIRLVLGQRERGARVLDDTAARARDHGLQYVVAAVERSRRHDPVAQLAALRAGDGDVDDAAVSRGEAIRARSLKALRAAADGEAGQARELAAATRREAVGADYALDRAICDLAEQIAGELAACVPGGPVADRGDAREDGGGAVHGDGGAVHGDPAAGAAGGVPAAPDPDLVAALRDALGHLRVIAAEPATPDRAARLRVRLDREAPAATCDDVGDAAVYDARTGAVVAGAARISFEGRPLLGRLFRELCAGGQRTVTKDHLIRTVWESEYDPLRHDSVLWANIRRLRRLLEPTALSIAAEDGGYRLCAPGGVTVIEPAR